MQAHEIDAGHFRHQSLLVTRLAALIEDRQIDPAESRVKTRAPDDVRDIEHAAVLEHRFAGVDNIEHALQYPPDFGRARVRGRVIQRVAHVRHRFACDWTSLWDLDNWTMLDLTDPFSEEERWQNMAHLRPKLEGNDSANAQAMGMRL